MTIERKLLGTTPVSGEVLPEAVSFDGSSDYLSRSSNMTGNADGKTFTFSCWIYRNNGVFQEGFIFDINGLKFHAYIYSDGVFRITARNSSGAQLLTTTSVKKIPNNTWTSVIMSIDLANTSNRYLAINDVIDTGNSYSHYVNDNIDFTDFPMNVATLNSNPTYMYQGRLSNLFLDYTYRDLSVTANRRLFIDAEGKPASGQDSVDNYSLTELYVGSQDNTPLEVFMSTDGTKFYMAGNTTNSVYQYNLSTAYDVSSASYNSVSLSVASQSTEPKGVTFSVDGTKMYIVEASNRVVYQYALTTGFDLSTASYTSKSFNAYPQVTSEPQDVSISSDGTRLYIIMNRHIFQYTLSTAYDVSTATYNSKTYNYSSQTVSGTGMAFGNSGTKLYVLGAVGAPLISIIFEYTLSTAWDVSTASYSNNSFIAAGRTNDNMGLALSSNGEHLYSIGNTGDSVFQYDMSTAYDLSTASGSSPTGSATTPILYLPMTDAATAGSNSGTGGDFTVNGVLATAQRGPNQDNCVASTLDGSADYLSRTSLTGAANSKVFTLSAVFSNVVTSGDDHIFSWDNGSGQIRFRVVLEADGSLKMLARDDPFSNNVINAKLNSTNNPLVANRQYAFSMSIDVSDSSKRHVYINGVAQTPTWGTVVDVPIDFTLNNYAVGGDLHSAEDWEGNLGEFYFNTVYTDLSTDNPFWDSDANRPNSVRKVIADTSVTPLIALPLIGSDAGNNLGSGGDFTVNSGPFTGARGGSEFWARSVKFDGCSNKLETTAAITSSTTYELSGFFFINQSAVTDNWVFEFNAGQSNCAFFIDTSNKKFILSLKSTSGAALGLASTANGAVWNAINQANTWIPVFFCVDVNNGTVFMQVQGASESYNLLSTVNPIVSFNSGVRYIGNRDNYECANYQLSNFYMTSSYIDFSQEANRNKFVDQLGYPIDLTDISDPFLYMKFDPSSLGTNSGTGGNFTVNGTVVAGADVDP